jgi:TatD DNase family protein
MRDEALNPGPPMPQSDALALVDSHAHLDDASFDDDRAAALARAGNAGVRMVVIPGIDATGWPRIATLCAGHASLFPAYGLHPLFLAHHRPEHLRELQDWLARGDAVALGEIGLDFFVRDLDPELQRHYFETQLDMALERSLPVIVHARRAVEEVLLALRKRPGLRGVVHSFAGSQQQAEQLCALGFHLGIGGPVTYARAKRLRRVVANLPIERLLLETDAPDQPNAGRQGERNEPAHMLQTLHAIAELRGQSPQAIATATTINACRLFGLPPPAAPAP